MFNDRGFTLIEVAVAMLLSVSLTAAVGVLSERLVHHRVSTDSNSAAASLAEQQMERLLALPNPSGQSDLNAGAHGPLSVDETGASCVGGCYSRSWTVVDNTSATGSPLVTPTTTSKKITVTVTHATNPMVRCELKTYYKIS